MQDKTIVCWRVKPVGEPCAGNLHARFDEREMGTEYGEAREAPATERVGNRYASPIPPRHLSTLPVIHARVAGRNSARGSTAIRHPFSRDTSGRPIYPWRESAGRPNPNLPRICVMKGILDRMGRRILVNSGE